VTAVNLGAPGAPQARVVVDMAGRSVEVPQRIERIVSPYRIATEMILTLGCQERLVGISTLPGHIMEKFYPEFKEMGRADRHASIEEILRLRPQVVFTSPIPQVKDLEQAGVKVFCILVEDPDSMIEGLKLIAEVLDQKERAADVADYYRQKLAYIREATAAVQTRKKVYVVGARTLTTVGGDFYQHHIVEMAGGINVARDLRGGWVSVSREHLVAWDPDVIVTIPYTTTLPDDILGDRGLGVLKAVRNNQIYSFPLYIDSWDLPTPESILGIMWLAGVLYPDQVHFDMQQEAREFYTRFYGKYPEPVHTQIAR